MPKVVSFTPAWLSKSSPGHDVFAEAQERENIGSAPIKSLGKGRGKGSKPGPKRTIARRGTEVFVAVGKEIRWADLVYLKEEWEETHSGNSKGRGRGHESESRVEQQTHGYRASWSSYIVYGGC